MRQRRPSLDGRDSCFLAFRRKEWTFRRKPGATSCCVGADLGAWVERQSCLRQAEAGNSTKCARQFGRRSLIVHRTDGRMERLAWLNWTKGLRMTLHDHGGDAELDSEIKAAVGALESIEETDAVEVLATWKETRMAITQKNLSRG